MRSNDKRSTRALILAGLFLAAPASHAGLIEQTQTLGIDFSVGTASFSATNESDGAPPTIVDNSTQSSDLIPSLTFDQFNEAVFGPLLSAVVLFEVNMGGLFSVDVIPLSQQDLALTEDVVASNLGMLAFDLGLPDATPLGTDFSATVACTASAFGAGCSTTRGASVFGANDMTSLGDLSSVIGSGMFDISASLASLVSVSTIPDNSTGGVTYYVDNATTSGALADGFVQGNVTVRYTYADSESVPVPGVFMLLVAGLLGLFIQRRRMA